MVMTDIKWTLSLISYLVLIQTSESENATDNATDNATVTGPPKILITKLLSTSTSSYSTPIEIPDIVATLAVIVGCALFGILISKAADFLYDKYVSTKSKGVDTSAQTKKLLKARVAIMRMKPDPKTPDGKIAKRAAAAWMMRVASKKQAEEPGSNQIGEMHVPGITINDTDAEKGNPTSTPKDKTQQPSTKESTVVEQTTPKQDIHPIEKINIVIKPGGPLPPVMVHDTPKTQ